MLTLHERNTLITNHIDYANRIAMKQFSRTPRCVQLDDLKSAAYMGLVDAARKYDGRRPFNVYAAYRIFGEIKDYLRSLRWSLSEEVKTQTLSDDYDVADRRNATEEIQFDELVEDLSDVKSQILKFHYWNNFTIKEIAKKVKLSQTRVHQIIKSSLCELRKCA